MKITKTLSNSMYKIIIIFKIYYVSIKLFKFYLKVLFMRSISPHQLHQNSKGIQHRLRYISCNVAEIAYAVEYNLMESCILKQIRYCGHYSNVGWVEYSIAPFIIISFLVSRFFSGYYWGVQGLIHHHKKNRRE